MIQSKITIQEQAEKIWQALTKKDQMKEWYFHIPDFELKVGTEFNFYEPGEKNEYHHRCIIKEIEPNKKLSYTWTHPSHSNGESLVTWLLNEYNGSTEVILQHNGIENFADAGVAFSQENYQMGWDNFLALLKIFVYGVRKHKYEINIHAHAEKVWDILWNSDSYTQWTAPFCKGAFYKGEMKQGSRIHFLSPGLDGMYSDVIFFKPPNNALFRHIGEIENGIELPIDEKTEKWTGAFENYILTETNGITTLIAEVDLAPEYAENFDKNFPKGLQLIKKISETNS